MPNILWWLIGGCALIAALLVIAAIVSLRRRRPLRVCLRTLGALMFIVLAIGFSGLGLGIEGYRALTHEQLAAIVQTEPIGPKRFRVQLRFPDGHEESYTLGGDELYVDAHILKWHPLANVFGFHTVYELDRVAGRYSNLVEEQQQPRTVFSVTPRRAVDLFSLRQRYALLSPLLDADYGSATFIAADIPAQYEVRVSTGGLLVRRVPTTN